MNKIACFISALVFTTLGATAQSILYSPYETNPELFSRSMLTINPFELTIGRDWGLTSTAKFETMVGKKIAPYISYTVNAITYNSGSNDPKYFHEIGTGPNPYKFELGATYYFLDENVDDFTNMDMGQSIKTDFGILTHQAIPSKLKHMLGLDLGLGSVSEMIETDQMNGYYLTNFTAKTSKETKYLKDNDKEYPQYLHITNALVMAGLRYKYVNRTIVKTGDGIKRHATKMYECYFDLMYAPSFVKNDFFLGANDSSIATPGKYSITTSSKNINNFGFRLGFHRTTSNLVGVSSQIEVGLAPGYYVTNTLFGRGAYIRYGVGISIGSKKYFRQADEKDPAKVITDKPKQTEPELENKKLNNI